jgi:hypothetical protein
MMKKSKIAYAILNWSRSAENTLMSLPEGSDVILCSPSEEQWKDTSGVGERLGEITYIDAFQNIAKSKNKIINFVKEMKKYDYLFIIEDDVIVKDTTIFQKYVDIMVKYDLGTIFYGFDKVNTLFDKVPNPGLIVTVSKDGKEEAWFNRFPCTSVIAFDLKRNDIKFNDNLLMIEMDVYLQDCANEKLIPYNGFYFDVPESWKYFERQDVPSERIKTREMIDQDKKYLADEGINLVIESNADGLIQLLKDKNGYSEETVKEESTEKENTK